MCEVFPLPLRTSGVSFITIILAPSPPSATPAVSTTCCPHGVIESWVNANHNHNYQVEQIDNNTNCLYIMTNISSKRSQILKGWPANAVRARSFGLTQGRVEGTSPTTSPRGAGWRWLALAIPSIVICQNAFQTRGCNHSPKQCAHNNSNFNFQATSVNRKVIYFSNH